MIKILPRTVKEQNGLRPFQTDTLEAMKNSDAKLIIVEAPVGSGKSHIVREIVNHSQGAVVLTYPTNILMNSQKRELKNDFPDSVIWPDETGIPKNNAPTIFYYSSDALIKFLKQQNLSYKLDRSELIETILHQHTWASKKNILLTTPDVLHLLVNLKAYRNSNRLISFFTQSIVVFDEFHLYIGLKHFSKLLENLFESGIKKILLLSATPVFSEELKLLMEKYKTSKIDFLSSVGELSDKIFNYPINLEFVNCRFTKRTELLSVLIRYIPELPKPLAIIFDSVFRLRHLKPLLEKEFGEKWKIIEYSGFLKDVTSIDEKTILIGTSSIEVGINMVFKSLITEVSYWTSGIQRIGRVGRFCEGNVIVLTTKNIAPYINSEKLTRDELENNVLKNAFKDIKMTHVCGEMFRGDSYPFIVYDLDSHNISTYTESIFAMFEPETWINDWQSKSLQQKKEQLAKYIKSEDTINELLLKDKLFPFLGIIEGRLRDKYEKIIVHSDDDAVTIICEESNRPFNFEKEKMNAPTGRN